MALRAVALVGVLLFTSACSDVAETSADPTPTPVGTSTPTAAASKSASAVASRPADAPDNRPGLLVAVIRPSGPLELRRVDRTTHRSTTVRALEAPVDGAQVIDVAMADGPEPVICASWHLTPGPVFDDLETALTCYPWGSSRGSGIANVERPIEIALTSAGTRIAWSLATEGESNPIFSTAMLSDGQVADIVRRRGQAAESDDAFTGRDIQDLAWTDNSHLAVSTSVQSDDGPELFHVDVDGEPGRGWLQDAPVVPGPTDSGYTTYDGVRSAGATTALARKRGYSLAGEGERPPDQAVRIDVASGRVLQVLATAAEGRNLINVSGTEEAVLYVTGDFGGDGGTDAKAYLRLPGESRGTLITGLPADFETVVAQG